MSSNPSILSHVSLGTNQLDRALAFYDKALGALGIGRVVDMSQEHHAVAYGRAYPEFWVQAPFNGKPAEVANGVHIAFYAETPAQVDAFYKAALEAGATDDGAPGPRPIYGKPYYGCFEHDPDGHKIEAMAWVEQPGA